MMTFKPRRPDGLTTQHGFAVIYTAVTLTAACLFVGLATDGLRAYLVKAQLTKAVDGAALGAARMLNGGAPAAQARELFRLNFPDAYMGTPAGADPAGQSGFYTQTTDQANGLNIIDIDASVIMPTMLMSLAGIPDVTVRGQSQATRRMVDLCLVLDVSSSLGARWPAVRDAARTFVAAFDENNDRFCLVRYSNGAEVPEPLTVPRGFNKPAVINAIPQGLPGGSTAMVEGLFRGWDELRTVPNGQQSSLRVLVLFTDGASNSIPATYAVSPATAKGLRTYDFPKNLPDPDNQTHDNPRIVGLFDTETGVRSPSYSKTVAWNSTSTLSQIPLLPATSFHEHARSSGIPTSFPLESGLITVNGAAQNAVRGLRNWDAGAGLYPADVWNINNASRNLLEIIADAARSETSGDYRIRIYTIGMGELVRYWLGTMPEQPEQILMRVANDVNSPDYNPTQIKGDYFFAATEADIGPAFQALQNQIIRLTR